MISSSSLKALVLALLLGCLAQGLSLGKQAFFNNAFQSLNLGGKISFDIEFSGTWASTPGTVATTFSVGLLAADQASYLGNPQGVLFQFDQWPQQGAATQAKKLLTASGETPSKLL